jgi:hypothetical protein
MNKLIVSIVTSTALAAGGTVMATSPVQADTENCVTKHEFNRVHLYWKKSRVTRVFDVPGKQTSSSQSVLAKYQSRSYRSCYHPNWDDIEVDFRQRLHGNYPWRVEWKYAYWS